MINNNHKVKSDSVSIIMNNPKMQKMIQEALDAPIGSTKRERAKAALKSVHQANLKNMDGQGGGYDGQGGIIDQGLLPWLGQQAPAMWNATKQVAGNVANAVTGAAKNAVTAGAITGSELYGLGQKVGSIPGATAQNAGAFIFGPQMTGGYTNPTGTPLSQTTGGQVANQIATQNPLKATILNGFSSNNKVATPTTNTSQGMSIKPSASTNITNPFTGASTPFANLFVAPLTTGKNDVASKVNNPSAPAGSVSALTPEELAALNSGLSDQAGAGASDSGSSSGSSSSTGFSALQNDVNLQIGADATWLDIASDEKKWNETFPGVPYPGGASLTRQTEKLYNTLKTEANLDQQKKAILDKQAKGATVEEDFQAYVHGKDQYVKEVDNMIDSNLNLMATTDMSDPDVRARMGEYMNYLYLIKGRQLTSYADYVDKSVKQYDSELTNMQTKYDSDYKNFVEEYNNKAAITAEDYTNYKAAITSMYNNLDGADTKALQKNILQQTYDSNALDIINTINKAANTSAGVNTDPMTASEQALYYKALGMNTDGYKLPSSDKDGNPLVTSRNADLYGEMARLAGENLRPEIFKKMFLAQIVPDVRSETATGDLSSKVAFYKKTIDSIQLAEDAGTVPQATAESDKATINLALTSGILEGLNSYLTTAGTTGALPIVSVQSAIKKLAGVGWFTTKSGITAADRKKFIDNNKGSVNASLLGIIFDQYAQNMSNGFSVDSYLLDRTSTNQSTSIGALMSDIKAQLKLI